MQNEFSSPLAQRPTPRPRDGMFERRLAERPGIHVVLELANVRHKRYTKGTWLCTEWWVAAEKAEMKASRHVVTARGFVHTPSALSSPQSTLAFSLFTP